MQEQIESYALTYEDLHIAFSDIANVLGEFYVEGEFSKSLPHFKSYYKDLAKSLRKVNSGVLVRALQDGNGVISAAKPQELLKRKLLNAQLASMCCIFDSWQVFLHKNIHEVSRAYVKHNLSRFENASHEQLATEYSKLSLLDAEFNIQLLKQLGLLPIKLDNANLISFGAAHGQKELYASHMVPCIETLDGKDGQLLVNFTAKSVAPAHTVLIDSDPFWSSYYNEMNARQGDKLLAINKDLYEALDELPQKLSEKSLPLRDFVTIWRLENQALPDVDKYFSGLSEIIKNDADFVVTIGAGNTDEEFADRQLKLNEISDYLVNKGMSPVRLILHKGNRFEPIFGQFRYASHEVLYCKLKVKLF